MFFGQELSIVQEQRLLICELELAAADLGVSEAAQEAILGVSAADMRAHVEAGVARDAEAQLRRFLEVAHLARALIGSDAAKIWMTRGDPRLGYASPLLTMHRPGGLFMIREMLRAEWEERTDGERGIGCHG